MTFPQVNIKYKPLDIVYMSNGEVGEEERYERLCKLSGREVIWIRGVNGRENAIRQAALSVTSKWFFLFPGKLWCDENFDFNWQPNRDYEPKHYIFYAENPLNGLVYGHQAMVCYNTQLVLETHEYGLDFTMSKLHDIVPVTSGVAQYNVDKIITWRTAFREAVKLCAATDSESKQRLEVWKNYARGPNCEWSILGAEDGIEYYKSVNGVHAELMKTFEWSWLDAYYRNKYQ
jgi:hypothetical protein